MKREAVDTEKMSVQQVHDIFEGGSIASRFAVELEVKQDAYINHNPSMRRYDYPCKK